MSYILATGGMRRSMRLDPEYLREHYSSLSDESLLEIDRSDLVGMAQQFYDAEMARRGLTDSQVASLSECSRCSDSEHVSGPEPVESLRKPSGVEDRPAWPGEAAEVYSAVVLPRRPGEEQMADARQILESAGIPCSLELIELTAEEQAPLDATHRWRLMVPGKFHLQAVSTLERDLSNPEFEAFWKAHLEGCENSEIRRMHPQVVFLRPVRSCGPRDPGIRRRDSTPRTHPAETRQMTIVSVSENKTARRERVLRQQADRRPFPA